jgi:iron-sulfur cluster repair protein YtfE (RIC family)
VNPVDLESSVPDWLIEYPELLALFQELGIDYSCGGKSLARACQERHLSVGDVHLRCERTIAPQRPE